MARDSQVKPNYTSRRTLIYLDDNYIVLLNLLLTKRNTQEDEALEGFKMTLLSYN